MMKTYPLTQSQLGIFMEWVSNPTSTQYNLPAYVPIDSRLDVNRMVHAIETVVKTRPMMRNRFVMTDGVPQQYADDNMTIAVMRRTMTDEQFADYRNHGFCRPFDLLSGEPLWRFEIVQTPSAYHLMVDCNHSVADGTACAQFWLADLPAAYMGEELAPTQNGQYEFAEEEHASFGTAPYERSKQYYAEKFADVNLLSLAPQGVSPWGELIRESAFMPSAEVDGWCEKHGMTVNNLFMAATGYVLSSYAHESRIAITTVNHGRISKKLANAYGMFVRSCPILFDVDSKSTVIDFVGSMRREMMSTIRYGNYPFNHFCNDLQQHMGVSFFFQRTTTVEVLNIGDVSTEIVQLPRGLTSNDVVIAIYTTSSGDYETRLESSVALHSHEYLAQLARCINTVVCQMMAAPDAQLGTLSVIDEQEQRQLIEFSKGEGLEYDKSQTWIDLFLNQVRLQPDATAVVDYRSSLTYGELNAQSIALAQELTYKGVQPGDFVAIALPRIKEFFVAVLAVQRAGAAYVPIDVNYPEDRKQYMLEDCEARLVIDEQMLAGCNITSPTDCEMNHAHPDGVAYMIYTSGSTGKPKGVPVAHRGIRASAAWYIPLMNFKPGKVSLHYPSFSFDASTLDIFYPLAAGAAVHIVSDAMYKDMDGIVSYMREHHVTSANMSAPIGMALLNQYDLDLECMMLGGEKFKPVKKTRTRLINGYGPTEFTVNSSYHVVDQEHDVDVPIGRPVPNSYSLICDSNGHLLPQGIAGELCLVGDQIAEGYWHRPDLTERSFVQCPFMPRRMYRTGDLARYNADGELEFLGRIDTQVKLHGFRIELGEIENRASQFDGITAAVAEVKEQHGNQHLVLYYVASHEVNEDDLRSFLGETLTAYMVPTVYVRLETMPVTPNGKVNRKALPEPVISMGEVIPPETDTEKSVFGIVSQLLNTEEFGVTNNLVGLGLSSILAMRLSASIQKELGANIKVGDIMKSPTVRKIVAKIDESQDNKSARLSTFPPREIYPLTESQRGVYVEWNLNRNTTQYNIPQIIRFKNADIDIKRLIDVVGSVIDSHPYVKSHIIQVDGDVALQRRDEAQIEIHVTSLDVEPSLEYLSGKILPFNLLGDDLLRVEIIKTPQAVYLITDVHHIVYDGMSGNVFFHDLFAAYNGGVLDSEPVTAFDYALYEEKLLKGESYSKAQTYFDDMKADANSVSYPDSTVPDGVASANVSADVPRADIDAFCSMHGVTASSYLQAAFSLTLSRITRESRPLFLTVSAGRSADVRLMRSIGMFVKTLPVSFEVNSSQSVADFVKTAHKHLQDSYELEFYPYTHFVQRHDIRPEIMFSYQGGLFDSKLSDLFEPIQLPLDTAKFPIDVTTYPEGQYYHIVIEYDGRRYGKADMQTLAKSIGSVAMAMSSVTNVADVSLLSATEENLVAVSSRGESMPVNSEASFPSLFISQANSSPNNVAVVDEAGQYSYCELNSLSASLAQHLAELEMNAEQSPFIAIMLGYQKEFLVASIGIERAGFAYVPLDYDYPNDRLLYMLEDSKSSLLVTTHAIFDEKNGAGDFNNFKETVFYIDDFLKSRDMPQDIQFNAAKPDSLAYMIYTSGSTGRPKGVMIPQSAKANFVQFIAREWHHSEHSRISCHSSFSFDASIEDLYPVLTVGGTLYIVPQNARKDLVQLHNFIVDNGITGGCYTTQLGQMLLQMYPDLPVDYLVVGGEKMTLAPNCKCHLINTYGPTEFTVDATYYDVVPGRDYHNIPIGHPVHNLAAYVTDQCGHLLPNGVAGELCMSGPQMAAGYWQRPEMTAEKFTTIDIVGSPVKVYHTGDLVKRNADGEIEYLGRIDNQVKLRGFRIEMGEIESRAVQIDGVKAAVAEVKTVNNNESLVLYFSADRNIPESELKHFLSQSLTDYMVPTVYVQLDEFPLTPNGKVNRKALPAPQQSSQAQQSAFVEPVGNIEIDIAEAFSNVLGCERISAYDDFFALGGSSMSAIKVLATLSVKEYQISYKDLFAYPTPRTLAAYLQGRIDASSNGEVVGPQAVDSIGDATLRSAYADVLEANTIDALQNGKYQPIGDVLLTGATGFMGIHMLHELLDNEQGRIYCILRAKGNVAADSRLRTLLFYYFENTYESLFGKRIFTIEGDTTDASLFERLDVKVDTVINCAANVKHFSAGDDIEKVNVESVKNLTEWCISHDSRFVQISTVSIAGQSIDGNPPADTVLTERMFDFRQSLGNQYVRSKYQAEQVVLDALKDKGLNAKIMRVATLSSRNSDGLFQINFRTNAFMGQLKAFAVMGCVPYDMLDTPCEFSPIDEVCRATRLLATTPREMVVFHPCNNHTLPLGDVLRAMATIGIEVQPVERDEFQQRVQQLMLDDTKSQVLQPILAYDDRGVHEMRYISSDSSHTTQVLYRLGYWWPVAASDYVERFMKSLGDLNYFTDV